MIHITKCKLKQLIRQNTRRIRKPKERMIRKHRPQTHRPPMQNSLRTHTTQTSMSMHNLNLLPNNNIPENREKGEDSWERGIPVYNEERDVVDFDAVRQISYACSSGVVVGYDYYFVAAVD